jgi:hypothetical protein
MTMHVSTFMAFRHNRQKMCGIKGKLLVNYHRPKLGLKKTDKNDPNQFYEDK